MKGHEIKHSLANASVLPVVKNHHNSLLIIALGI